MKLMGRMVVSLLAVVLTVLGSYAAGQPVTEARISFSLPFCCGGQGGDRRKANEVICLADSFEPGLKVVLVSREASCTCKTADTFHTEHGANEFKATHLTGTAKCLTKADNTRFEIAVVGGDHPAARVVSVMDDKSPVSREMELKAWKLADRYIKKRFKKSHYPTSISEVQPKVISTDNVTILIFETQVTYEETGTIPWESGPAVALTNAGAFLLEGTCAYTPFFFTVNNKLYVTYWATVDCCGCGDTNFFVYDLSGDSPKLVYHNNYLTD